MRIHLLGWNRKSKQRHIKIYMNLGLEWGVEFIVMHKIQPPIFGFFQANIWIGENSCTSRENGFTFTDSGVVHSIVPPIVILRMASRQGASGVAMWNAMWKCQRGWDGISLWFHLSHPGQCWNKWFIWTIEMATLVELNTLSTSIIRDAIVCNIPAKDEIGAKFIALTVSFATPNGGYNHERLYFMAWHLINMHNSPTAMAARWYVRFARRRHIWGWSTVCFKGGWFWKCHQ